MYREQNQEKTTIRRKDTQEKHARRIMLGHSYLVYTISQLWMYVRSYNLHMLSIHIQPDVSQFLEHHELVHLKAQLLEKTVRQSLLGISMHLPR